jgi:CTP synthase
MRKESNSKTKYVIVTGGVLSGLGKGILGASIGNLFSKKYKVISIKCDGYLNVDPGTMNPIEHGEVFVLDDGAECDMDFGHYERFLNVNAKGKWNLTMGKVFNSILKKERKGEFLGKTVQFIPHVTDEIKNTFYEIEKEENADIIIIEIGGTVGDLENGLYLEAARQLKQEKEDDVLFTHLSYVPVPYGVNEQKSKPTQMSVKSLNEIGIRPDIIVCRCSNHLEENIKDKISLFCNLPKENVFTSIDLPSVYLLPSELKKQGLLKVVNKKFGFDIKEEENNFDKLAKKLVEKKNKKINIGICGKYSALEDSYASVIEALNHASANLAVDINTSVIDVEQDHDSIDKIGELDGIIVPGGFGSRGWEEKINVIKYAREKNIPFLGICLGLQAAVVEFSRNVCKLNADSIEMNDKADEKVIALMDEQKNVVEKGGTMRLGSFDANIASGTIISELYSSNLVSERHRHRFEVNPEYHKILEENGLTLSGLSNNNKLVEFIELKNHKYFVATQAHPELKSKLEYPAPLFYGLVKACIK